MALNPQIIGKEMPHGFAGSYARQPDMIVATRPAGADCAFGQALAYNTARAVVPMAGKDAVFAGVAAREVKSSLNYLEQNTGGYAAGDPVSVFQRGSINVKCQNGKPAAGGDVYVRVAANASLPAAVAGGFEAAADGENSVKLAGCQWGGTADANGIAELVVLTRANA